MVIKKMSRRSFSKKAAAAGLMMSPGIKLLSRSLTMKKKAQQLRLVRLGGPVYHDEYNSPGSWIIALKQKGYASALCPVDENASDDLVKAYELAAAQADISIAEVGAWSNPIHPVEEKRDAAIEKCILKLDLADRIGARCCVNVSGSRGTEKNGGPHPDNFTSETFDMIVETTRKIIDAVKPRRTFFVLETMPYAIPDSIESYVALIEAIDRDAFGAHFDPVNLINSPRRYYDNAALIREGFRKLGKYLRSCHAKDTLLSNELTTHLDEVVPGQGNLNYRIYLEELSKLDGVPLIMEHMARDQYPLAAKYIRSKGKEIGLVIQPETNE